MQINERIKIARKNAGITQRQVGEALGTTQQQYGKYETGQQEMTTSRFKAFCKICNCSADWILETGEYSIEI